MGDEGVDVVIPFLAKAIDTFQSCEGPLPGDGLKFKKGQEITVEKIHDEIGAFYGFFGKKEGWFEQWYVRRSDGEPQIRGQPKVGRKKSKKPAAYVAPEGMSSELAKEPSKRDIKREKKNKKRARKKGKKCAKKGRGTKRGIALVNGIPAIVEDTVAFLEKEDRLKIEGLFRVSGSLNDVKNIKSSYMQGTRVDLSRIQDPHTVAGVLKIYFRELQEPLLTHYYYDAWIAAIARPTPQEKIQKIKQTYNCLPKQNGLILKRLMKLLREIAKHSDVNLMTVNNIAIVFAPTLLRPPGDKIALSIQNASYQNNLVRFMIENYDEIFENVKTTAPSGAAKEEEEFETRLRRGSMLMMKGSIIGSLEDEAKEEDAKDTSIDIEVNSTSESETGNDTTEPDNDDDDDDDDDDVSSSSEPTEAMEESVEEGPPQHEGGPYTLETMIKMILEGQVEKVDSYLATLDPTTANETKKKLVAEIDLWMKELDSGN
eukprot:TRINITY_DN4954_c0_g1_i1.p1 TRINITY_DN4954_c0_g1~~TRINITY_DN4954_c0_g1_i1.p1  ORF type:complete len:485 (-),score=108.41 TRINITY_DN4954_c0_g1_i1:36-1490(-)